MTLSKLIRWAQSCSAKENSKTKVRVLIKLPDENRSIELRIIGCQSKGGPASGHILIHAEPV